MHLYLDCADRVALEPLLATGLFRGVTTNPLILRRAGVRLAEVPALVEWLVEHGCEQVFVQTTTGTADEMTAEGHRLRALTDRMVVKVPATATGLTATARLTRDGVPVLVTAVYHARQVIAAAAAGAGWVAPYVGRMTEQGRDGHGQVEQMQRILAGSGTGVLAASIRSADDVRRLALAGAEAVTLGTAEAHDLLADPLTDAAVAEFDRAVAELS